MCSHCATLQRHLPALARGDHSAFDCARVTLREIRAAANYKVIARGSRANRSIADALRHVVSACWKFIGTHSQANYNEIERSISAYFAAIARANNSTKTRILNPNGKPEPIGSPRHFSVAPDCYIYEKHKSDPGQIVANVQHARHVANAHARNAKIMMQKVRQNEKEGNIRAAALAHSFAIDSVGIANDIEETLAEYVSIYR